MNRRRIAALLRALADEIDETAPERKPPLPDVEIDEVSRARARQALRRAGLVGSGAKSRRHAIKTT